MSGEGVHLSQEDLLLAADGELSPGQAERVNAHLAACESCRTRMDEIEAGLEDFVRAYHGDLNPQLPPPDRSRALLRAQLAEISAAPRAPGWLRWARKIIPDRRLQWACIAGMLALAAVVISHLRPLRPHHGGPPYQTAVSIVPAFGLTPGATRPVPLKELCGGRYGKNAVVVSAIQQQVFAKYGLRNVESDAFEVDYLITPALGGSDDIRNLWPQPYSSAVWNAYVKDALEDKLHEMVCSGQVDLATAQRDIATDWIQAYKKYFRTDRPISRDAAEPASPLQND